MGSLAALLLVLSASPARADAGPELNLGLVHASLGYAAELEGSGIHSAGFRLGAAGGISMYDDAPAAAMVYLAAAVRFIPEGQAHIEATTGPALILTEQEGTVPGWMGGVGLVVDIGEHIALRVAATGAGGLSDDEDTASSAVSLYPELGVSFRF